MTGYIPDVGDIAIIDFDPHAGHEPGKRRPVLVLTDQHYNRASGLAIVCPLTRTRKPYPFALSVELDKVEGAVLIDQIKVWTGRLAKLSFTPKQSLP